MAPLIVVQVLFSSFRLHDPAPTVVHLWVIQLEAPVGHADDSRLWVIESGKRGLDCVVGGWPYCKMGGQDSGLSGIGATSIPDCSHCAQVELVFLRGVGCLMDGF